MKLNILISTIDQGIEKITDIILPYRDDVSYIISHQYQDKKYLSIPKELIREDVLISQISGKGLTKSRNNAILNANGDICVIADDDVRYSNEYFDIILDIYNNNDVDLACFKIYTGSEQPVYKMYPKSEIEITSKFNYSPSSIEMTFKLGSIKNNKIFFDERFGLGSYLIGGEESLFVHDVISSRLKVKFFPFYIVQHPYESTIKVFSKYDKCRNKVEGAIDLRLNGKIAILKAFAATLKKLSDLLSNRKNPLKYLYERLSGVYYILNSKK